MELAMLLACDGAKIKTPFFSMHINVPGTYRGTEKTLPEGVKPELKLLTTKEVRDCISRHLEVFIDGKMRNDCAISRVYDRASGTNDELITRGRIVSLTGTGLKVGSSEENRDAAGVFFECPEGTLTPAVDISRNEATRVNILVPESLKENIPYHIVIKTQYSPASGGTLLKELRHVRTEKAYMVAA
jgi:hypothetical protein